MADKKTADVASKDEGDAATDAPDPTPAPAPRADETVPGGRFVVDGAFVDANGTPIKE